ncbi:iron ABC transporter permease [uncultured Paenibacillus sp.]|uniref:FecCD family ABC transporter permease n=1 Tax=uncultured Paenibacillus sp. TaxID=227322 RepID=UPI0028D115DA|nr:iron ABC transporter permease [uncultured Paenibacillus sp.]
MNSLSQHLVKISPARRRLTRTVFFFITGIVLLFGSILVSIATGAFDVSLSTILAAVFAFDGSKEHLIIQTIRIPRAFVTAFVGANLAVAGALMQAITRNPLASPGVLGVNAGAAFVVVLLSVILPGMSGIVSLAAAFAGGAAAASVVYFINAHVKGGSVEVKMALTGVAVQALLASLTQSLLIFNDQKTEMVLFWLAGSAAGMDWTDVKLLLPWSIAGLIAACCLGRSASVIGLGEETARGLGQRTAVARGLCALMVVVLAGVSVSIAGPIGFVGLIVPHIARYLVGVDYRVVIPVSAIFGSVLLVLADIASRFVSFPYETPVGVVTALIGTPYFIYLARRKRKVSK